MKRLFSIVTVAIALMATASPLLAQDAGVVGTWDISIAAPQGTQNAQLVIRKEGDKLGGAIKGARGERPLESVTLKGDEITFVMKAPAGGPAGGMELVMTFKGKVEKDSMKGDADFGGLASGTWSAVPHKEGAAPATTTAPAAGAAAGGAASDVSGAWSFTVETQAGTGHPEMMFKQEGEKLTGTYKGQLGEGPLTGTIKGNDIQFQVKVNVQGQALDVVYTGKVEGKDSMKGKVRLGDLGEGDWTAKRK